MYVTEAKSGAVADIRSDCVPTSPIYGKELNVNTLRKAENSVIREI